MKYFRVKYKTPHNLLFRRFWLVKSATLQKNPGDTWVGDMWKLQLAFGRLALIPAEGTIIVFGRGHRE